MSAATQRAKTHCPAGHAYEGDNLYVAFGRRYCKTCVAARVRKHRANRRAAA